jgi:hypothetical protein
LQEYAVPSISNATGEVFSKQVTNGVTIANIEEHQDSWCMKAKKKNQKPKLRPICG